MHRFSRKAFSMLAFRSLFALPILFLTSSQNLTAQTLTAKIAVPVSSSEIRVQVEFPAGVQSWSFRNSYAGAIGLGYRIKDFRGSANGLVRNVTGGEFRADERIKDFSYAVNLNPANHESDLVHISWLTADYGFLMLSDLLPQFLGELKLEDQDVQVELELPAGWTSSSALNSTELNRYQTREPENAVFLVGRDIRVAGKSLAGVELGIATGGVMPFKSSDAMDVAARVVKKYTALTKYPLQRRSVILAAPFPLAQTAQWRAETRGSSTILILNPRARQKNWVGQLGVIFTHELLHFWVPNSLRLKGDYDWFFEGFTLYEALLAAVDLKLITFREYLATLSRVYDSYLAHSDNLSLLEASERRWTGNGSFVYDKGMLVAFMYDLIVRQESRGNSGLADRYPALFTSAGEAANANDAIIGLLGSSPATQGFIKSYIEGRQPISLERFLPTYGLQLDSRGSNSHLFVNKELNAEQKEVLRSLGYKH
jgi:predicted metalloprotease with PDZ domain